MEANLNRLAKLRFGDGFLIFVEQLAIDLETVR